MKTGLNQIVVLGLAIAFVFGFSSARAADDATVGKVRRIFVEGNYGVRMEQTQAPRGAKLWAEIDFGAHSAQPRRRVTVQVAPGLKAEPGDLVKVTLAWPAAADKATHAPLPETSRVTLLTAKWFTPQADAFDGSPLAASSRLRAASPGF